MPARVGWHEYPQRRDSRRRELAVEAERQRIVERFECHGTVVDMLGIEDGDAGKGPVWSREPEFVMAVDIARSRHARIRPFPIPDSVRTSCFRLHTVAGIGFGPLTWRRAAHLNRFGGRCTLPTAQSTRSIEQDEPGA